MIVAVIYKELVRSGRKWGYKCQVTIPFKAELTIWGNTKKELESKYLDFFKSVTIKSK